MELTIESLRDVVEKESAIRRIRWMQPIGGKGDKLFPPTYPGQKKNGPPQHVFEYRRIGDRSVLCVLLDGCASQANRHEAVLKDLRERKQVHFPAIGTSFENTEFPELGTITTLDAPHRFCDPILRDSQLGEEVFRRSEDGVRLFGASPANAQALYEFDPVSINHGAWNSSGGKGVFGAKFVRAVTSEIIGVDVVTEPNGEPSGRRTSSRIDPLGIVSGVRLFKLPGGEWTFDRPPGRERDAGVKPSEVLHGNIKPSVQNLGVSVDHALHTFVIAFKALGNIRFPQVSADAGMYARCALVALELAAALGQDAAGYFLRSRCDLVPMPSNALPAGAPSGVFELVRTDGTVEPCEFDLASVCKMVANAAGRAAEGGLRWRDRDLVLTPQPKLLELIKRSRQYSLASDGKDDEQDDE